MANYGFKLYFEGYESPKHLMEIDNEELENMADEEKEEYIFNNIMSYVRESIEVIEIEEE